MRVRISRCVAQAIQRESAAAEPREACGLLFGEGSDITAQQVTENIAERPEREFEIDPRALFAALRGERAGGKKIAGYWHSHPGGDARPSRADAARAVPDGRLWLIAAGGELSAWRAGEGGLHGRFEPVELDVAEDAA